MKELENHDRGQTIRVKWDITLAQGRRNSKGNPIGKDFPLVVHLKSPRKYLAFNK